MGMFGRRKEPDESKTIPKDRYRVCPKCRKEGLHKFVSHPTEDVWICPNPHCKNREVIPAKPVEEKFTGLTDKEREKTRQNILSVAGDLTTHK